MVKNLKSLIVCFSVALLLCSLPAVAAPGAAIKAKQHATVNAAPLDGITSYTAVDVPPAYNVVTLTADIPKKATSVPRTKVYLVTRYFGMPTLVNISQLYARANLPITVENWRLIVPPNRKLV